MVWHLIKYGVSFIIFAFYKRVQGKNIQRLRVKGPVIVAMNHPNAFMDPIAITGVSYPQRLKYLARGDAFKPGLASWLLERIGIVPIYRLQDGGVEGLKKNDEAYRRVNQLLKKNNKIIVFAEGICVQERRLRPLKKGVARMVFGAYESLPHEELTVVPVGVNYSKPDMFRSTVFYNVGEPIAVKDFMARYRENPARANNLFLQALEPRMRELITHINDKRYDEAVYMTEALSKRNWLKARGLDYKNLEHDFMASKHFTDLVNTAVERNPAVADEFMSKGKEYFRQLDQNGLKDWLVDPEQNGRVTPGQLFGRRFLLVLGMPLYLVGLLGNYPPYLLSKTLTKKIAKNREFYASMFMGLAMFIFTLNYVLWFLLVYAFSPTIGPPLLVCLVLALSAWFSLHFYTFRRRTLGMARAIKNTALMAQLLEKRIYLLSLLNKF